MVCKACGQAEGGMTGSEGCIGKEGEGVAGWEEEREGRSEKGAREGGGVG